MGQRDLTVRWAVEAGKAKRSLIEKGLVVDDGGAFFGWGVEHGHLVRRKYFADTISEAGAEEAVQKWKAEQQKRASDEHYFAMLWGPEDEIGKGLCNYQSWWSKIKKAIDPEWCCVRGWFTGPSSYKWEIFLVARRRPVASLLRNRPRKQDSVSTDGIGDSGFKFWK